MSARAMFVVILLAAIAASLSSTLFTVQAWERAVLFKLGEIVRTDFEPGLHWKIPLLNTVRTFDGRVQTLDSQPERFLTSEKKNVVVDSFVMWRIGDVARFYTAVRGDPLQAGLRLEQVVKDGLRGEFSKRSIQDVIAGERSKVMGILREQTDRQAREMGIEVVDVRIKRVDFPPEVSHSVYQRMDAERARVARDFRSRGAEQAERIRADADRQRTIIVAEAYRDSEQARGEGDARAARIYAEAYGKDREFYNLYRSLGAYRKVFDSGHDTLVMEPDSEFFRYFRDAGGKGAP